MKVSIALATYNGAKYLKQQLDSIHNQTRQPDELVVCDDCSKDSTVEILHEFKEKANFSVNIVQNESNLGYTGNFEKAISLCLCDLIFVCDQDDYWLSRKIETMAGYMEKHPEVFIAINDTEIVGKELTPTGVTKVQQIKNLYGGTDKFIPGCCSVFRSSWSSLYQPFPVELDAYDGWLHYIGKVFERREVLTTSLQYYRIHGENTSNFAPNSPRKLGIKSRLTHIWQRVFKDQKGAKLESLRSQINMNKLLLERINAVLNNPGDCTWHTSLLPFIASIENKNFLLQLRIENIQNPSPILIGKLIKILVSRGEIDGLTWKTIISDLVAK